MKITALLLAVVVACLPAFAEEPGKLDAQAEELASLLIGAPVLSKDGVEVGQVFYVIVDETGQPDRVFIVTDSHLGFGPRTLELSKYDFLPVRGAIVLEVPALEVLSLPSLGQ
jgi:hypothetical protein